MPLDMKTTIEFPENPQIKLVIDSIINSDGVVLASIT